MGVSIFGQELPTINNPLGDLLNKDINGNPLDSGDTIYQNDILDGSILSAASGVESIESQITQIQQANPMVGDIANNDLDDAYGQRIEGEFARPVYDKNGKLLYNSRTVASKFGSNASVPSLMNGYAVIHHFACKSPDDYRDLEGKDGAFPKFGSKGNDTSSNNNLGGTGGRKLTVESLLHDFPADSTDVKDPRYPTPFYVADFLYSKHFLNIPLNRLITLRRYPHPTYDNLQFGAQSSYSETQDDKKGGVSNKGGATNGENIRSFKPLAQAVTYFGEPTGNKIESLTKINGSIKWKSFEAEVNTYTGEQVAGFEQVPFANKLGKLGKTISVLTGKGDLSGRGEEERRYAAAYTTEDFLRKPYGPVNSITKTHVRDRGLEANMKFSLTFEYQLRSYSNVNPRIAMIDIFCNMLALCYNHGKFWGGLNRYFPNDPQFAFLGNQKAYYEGDYEEYSKTFVQSMSKGVGGGADILKNVMNSIMNLDFSSVVSQLSKSIGGKLLDMQSAKGRPHMIGMRALLTGDPVGEWHMMVGNPYRPILMVGNLIVTDWEMFFGGHLGVDDFPSELKWVINLEQGMPRDSGGLQSIFNSGQGKMYYKPVSNQPDVPDLNSPDNKNANQTGTITWHPKEHMETLHRISEEELKKFSGTLF